MSQCPSTSYLRVGGADVATLRCDEDEGHGGPHEVAFYWVDGDLALDWPEAHDPDEGFDVEVDALEHEAAVDAAIAARSIGDDLAVERSHDAVETAVREYVSPLDLHLEQMRAELER